MASSQGGLPVELRLEIEDLCAEYCAALDDGRYEDWPELFTEECLYRIVPRDNFDRGLPIALMHCESRLMLRDRVVAVRETAYYAPRLPHSELHSRQARGGRRDPQRGQLSRPANPARPADRALQFRPLSRPVGARGREAALQGASLRLRLDRRAELADRADLIRRVEKRSAFHRLSHTQCAASGGRHFAFPPYAAHPTGT